MPRSPQHSQLRGDRVGIWTLQKLSLVEGSSELAVGLHMDMPSTDMPSTGRQPGCRSGQPWRIYLDSRGTRRTCAAYEAVLWSLVGVCTYVSWTFFCQVLRPRRDACLAWHPTRAVLPPPHVFQLAPAASRTYPPELLTAITPWIPACRGSGAERSSGSQRSDVGGWETVIFFTWLAWPEAVYPVVKVPFCLICSFLGVPSTRC